MTRFGSGTTRRHSKCRAGSTPACGPASWSLPKGLWRRHVAGGLTANALVPDTIDDLAGGACFNDARVEVALR